MSKTKNVVNLFERSRKKVPELALDIPTKSTTIPQETAVVAYVLPQDRPKLILVIGSGGRGKSLVLRYIAEEAMARDGMTLATLAPNRTLKHYFPETAHPEGNSTSAGAAFLEMFFDVVAENQVNAGIDFPGDDTALLHLLDQGVDPVAMLEQAGVEVVVLYMLSPRVEDLTAMAQLQSRGFNPKATALVLNVGITADPTMPAEPEFDLVREHSAYQRAIENGAVEIWMPRLYAAKAIEEQQLLFSQARDGHDLGPSDRSRTHAWLRAMEEAFRAIASWLP